jgi:GTPase involved in cell partitioning and DNA repair
MSGDVLLDTEHWFVSSILPGLDVAGLAHRGEGQAASDRRLVHCMQRVLEEHVMDIDPRTQAHRAATCKNLQAEIKSLQAQLGETQEAEEGEEEEEETELHSRELMAALRMQAASLKRHKQQRQWVKDGILHHMRVMREELAMTSSAEEEEEGE